MADSSPGPVIPQGLPLSLGWAKVRTTDLRTDIDMYFEWDSVAQTTSIITFGYCHVLSFDFETSILARGEGRFSSSDFSGFFTPIKKIPFLPAEKCCVVVWMCLSPNIPYAKGFVRNS